MPVGPLGKLKSRIATVKGCTLRTLETKAGSTPRPRGRAWMRTRERVAMAGGYRCVDCGRVWIPSRDEVDHQVPLEQGGSNDDSNLRLRCDDCHKAKTKAEAQSRWGGVGSISGETAARKPTGTPRVGFICRP